MPKAVGILWLIIWGDLGMSFEWKPFTELLIKIIDNRGKTCPVGDSGIPLIATNCISNNSLYPSYDTTRYVSAETYKTWFRGHPLPNDIIFVCKGSPGRVNWTPNPVDFCIAQDMVAVRADPIKIYSKYLFAALRSSFVQSQIDNLHVGTMIPHFKKGDFDKLNIPVPSKETQIFIGDYYFAISERVNLLRETNTTLEAIAQTLFKSWFVDFAPVKAKAEGKQPEGMDEATAALFPSEFEESALGLIPKGWRVGTIKELGEVICGKTPPTAQPENYGDEVPFITIPDMHNVLLITSTNRSLSKLGANTQKKKYLPVGSICVSCIATAGLVARVTVESQTNQQINSVVPFDKWGKSFPLFILRRIGDAVRAGGSGGSIFHNLNKSNFEQLSILLPNQILAHKFEIIVEPIIHQIENNQKQSQTLTNLRDTLLPRLISGQLRINQPQDVINEVGA